jgi:hypothetical protein
MMFPLLLGPGQPEGVIILALYASRSKELFGNFRDAPTAQTHAVNELLRKRDRMALYIMGQTLRPEPFSIGIAVHSTDAIFSTEPKAAVGYATKRASLDPDPQILKDVAQF